MIVKNEESFLEQCLQSVQDLVDEIIIVDTGSTDKTKEIARRFTDKVFDFKWCDDFAAARNESLKYATGDWILVLDADEMIAKEDFGKIQEMISKGLAGYSLKQRNYINSSEDITYGSFDKIKVQATGQNNEGFVYSKGDKYKESEGTLGWITTPIVRFFRNSKDLAFVGVVHEDVSHSIKGKIESADVPIHHFGKLNASVWKKKEELYERLGERKVQEEKDYHAYFELGRQYLAGHKIEEAQEMFLKSAALNDSFWVSWFNLGGIHLIKNELDEALKCLLNAKKLNPNNIDVYTNLGVIYARKKEFQKAIDTFVLGLNINPNQPDIFKNMGLCYEEMGDMYRAKLAFSKEKEIKESLKK